MHECIHKKDQEECLGNQLETSSLLLNDAGAGQSGDCNWYMCCLNG